MPLCVALLVRAARLGRRVDYPFPDTDRTRVHPVLAKMRIADVERSNRFGHARGCDWSLADDTARRPDGERIDAQRIFQYADLRR